MFGTALEGGTSWNCSGFGCGAVYNTRPPRTVCNRSNCTWSGTAILSFDSVPGGDSPNFVDPVFDL
jgi:hypothetical protein